MSRNNRLLDLLGQIKDGQLHRAEDLAQRFGVSVRTIYRDMERLQASGVPVEGTRGEGYRSTGLTTLPPLSLSDAELNVLSLGVAIIQQAGDSELAQAAETLAQKINATLPEQVVSDAESWKFAFTPLADVARGLELLPTLRSAIRARQKVELKIHELDGALTSKRVHPLRLDNFGPVWTLHTWSEGKMANEDFRLDLLVEARALPELFTLTDDAD